VYRGSGALVNYSVHGHKPLSAVEAYREAVRVLREGGVVALPTDTVFGLCAVAADRGAVERIYEIKQRDPSQPMPLFVSSMEQVALIAEINTPARALSLAFWPGSLTIVLRKKPAYESRALGGGDTVGVRAPDDAALREMTAQLGPLTGTSANIAGREECHTAAQVYAQLGASIDLIVDAPVDTGALPSTIVDCVDARIMRVVREGAVSGAALTAALAGIAALG
jgi:L-threonylcarbamoyladenylate synthase